MQHILSCSAQPSIYWSEPLIPYKEFLQLANRLDLSKFFFMYFLSFLLFYFYFVLCAFYSPSTLSSLPCQAYNLAGRISAGENLGGYFGDFFWKTFHLPVEAPRTVMCGYQPPTLEAEALISRGQPPSSLLSKCFSISFPYTCHPCLERESGIIIHRG